MHPVRHALRLFLVATLLPAAGQASDLSKLLAKSISPSSVAMLAPYSKEPTVQARWKEALLDGDPRTRGVAARAITTCNVAALLPDVERALAGENDADAASEEIRAICLLGGEAQDEEAITAAARFQGALDGELVRAIARARGPAALLLYFSKLRALSLSETDRAAFFRLVSRGGREGLDGAASMSLGRRDPLSWKAVLLSARSASALAGSPVLRTALETPNPDLRGEAAWFLARAYSSAPAPDAPALLSAIEKGEASGQAPKADAEEAFGMELLKRALGQPAVEHPDWIACLLTNPECHLDADIAGSPLLRLLTPKELKAVEARNRRDAVALPGTRPGFNRLGESSTKKGSDLWLLGGLPAGLGGDLLRDESCDKDAGSVGLADVAYRPDGRPASVTIRYAPKARACEQMLASIYLLSLAPSDLPTSEDRPLQVETVLLPDVFDCASGDAERTARPNDVTPTYYVRGKIVPPVRSRFVNAVYPPGSAMSGEHGVVVVQGVIGTTGCVGSLHVLRSATPLLDIAALAAISQWRYSPATLSGSPVPVCLTVTINFTPRHGPGINWPTQMPPPDRPQGPAN